LALTSHTERILYAVILLWQSGTTRCEEQDGASLKLKVITYRIYW